MVANVPPGQWNGVPGMRGLLVTVNRDAGTADDDAVKAAVSELRRTADVTVAATADESELADAVAELGERRLVVIGGDGSVHAALRALDRAGALHPDRPVGIIPRGTGNDFAGAIGLTQDPVAAAGVVLGGRPRLLDLLRDDDGGLVLNAVHAGVGARASAEAMRFKSRLGTAAFPLGAAIAGVTTTGSELRIEVDGEVATHEAGDWAADGSTDVLMFGVCNGPTIAGGTPLAPGALLDDGLADVVVCTATGPVARAAYAAALVNGSHVERPDVLVTRARQVTFSGPPTEVVADGELQEPVGSRTWRVEHPSWSCLVP
jgi:diacylglycerol kinase family enzyme